MFIASILTWLQRDDIPKGNLGQKAMYLSLRLKSIGYILIFFYY